MRPELLAAMDVDRLELIGKTAFLESSIGRWPFEERLLRTRTGFAVGRFAAIFRDFAGEDDLEGRGRARFRAGFRPEIPDAPATRRALAQTG
jgi:hypothetical protein